ncbi:MAG: RND transporter, partial [Verrucomicrobia bacterium]
MSRSPEDSLLTRSLRALAGWVSRRRHWFVWPQLLLLFASVAYTGRFLEFDTNRDNLVASDTPARRDYLHFMEAFNAQSELIAVVESADTEKNRQFVERLGPRLEAETNLFQDVFYKGDLRIMGPKALMLVTEPEVLDEMAERLREARPVLERFSQVTNLHSLFGLVIEEFRSASGQSGDEPPALLEALPALTRMARQAADALRRPGLPPSPGVSALFDSGPEAESSLYITFASNRIYLVTARVAPGADTGQAVARFRELVDQVRAEVPGVNAGVTGEPVLEVDEMAQSQRDMAV